MSFLDNLKVSAKVGVNSGILIVFLLVASGMAVIGLNGADRSFGEYRVLARQSNAASEVTAHLLSARIAVKDFLQTGQQETVEAVRRRIGRADTAATAAVALSTDPATRAKLQQSKADSATYLSVFESLLPLRERRDQLVETLNRVGPEAERALSEALEAERRIGNADAVHAEAVAMRQLLLARVYANRFLVENGEQQVARVTAEIAELRRTLADLDKLLKAPESRPALSRMTIMVDEYASSFAAVAKTIFERNGIVRDRMDVLGRKIAADIEAVKENLTDRQDALGPQASADIDRSLWVAVTVSAVALVIGIVLALLIGRGIAGPIGAMTAAMGRLAGGDKSAEIPAQGRRDEVGAMAAAVQVFKDSMIRAEQLAAEQEAERAAREARARRIEELTRGFDQAVASVLTQFASSTDQLQSTASSMSATAEETNRQASAVAAASEQASANVQAVASASEELAGSIEEIGRQVTQSARIANQASPDAEATNAQVQTLAEAARKVGEVVNLIQDIAAQTNLLALNATIEAARAGEMGKGFAVVAGEVKSLAAQTARATEEIGQHIGGIQTATGDAVTAIQGIGSTISEINEIAGSIASAVEEQGAATREISRNVQEAAKGTHEVSRNITGVTQAASDTGTAAEQVNASAGQLSTESGTLRRTVEEFLAGVRAA